MNKGIKKLKDGTYRVRVTQVCPMTGRKQEKTKTVLGNARDAEMARAELLATMGGPRAQQRKSPERIRLKDWLAYWFQKHAPEWKFSTKHRRAQLIDSIAATRWGDYYLDALAPSDVEDLLRFLGQKWAGNTVRQAMEIVRTSTKDAIKHRIIDRWPCEGVRNPIPIKSSRKALAVHEAQLLLALCRRLPGEEYATMAATSLLTGLRWCEVSALEKGDLRGNCLSVERAQYNGHVGTPKNGEPRLVPVHDSLLTLFRALPERDGPLLFASRTGVHRTYRRASKVLTALCLQAGVPRVTWHELRHTANDLHRRLTDKLTVQKILGHSDDAMTERYSHVDMGEMMAATDRLVSHIESAVEVGVKVGLRDLPN